MTHPNVNSSNLKYLTRILVCRNDVFRLDNFALTSPVEPTRPVVMPRYWIRLHPSPTSGYSQLCSDQPAGADYRPVVMPRYGIRLLPFPTSGYSQLCSVVTTTTNCILGALHHMFLLVPFLIISYFMSQGLLTGDSCGAPSPGTNIL